MSLFLVSLLVAQSVSNATPPAPSPAAKQKPKQVCESIAITGSRARERVCHNVDEAPNLKQYGVSDTAYGKGTFKQGAGWPVPSLSPQ